MMIPYRNYAKNIFPFENNGTPRAKSVQQHNPERHVLLCQIGIPGHVYGVIVRTSLSRFIPMQ